MKGRTNILLIAVFATCIAGCERYKLVDMPAHTPKLVVHAYVETGDFFRMTIGRSFASDEAATVESTYVTNARVILYENNVVMDTLDYDPIGQIYYSQTAKAVAGRFYKVMVTAPGFPDAEASCLAPLPIQATAVERHIAASTNTLGQTLDDVVFSFQDPPNESNHYLAELRGGYNFQNTFCVYSYDPAVEKYQAGVNPFEASSCVDNREVLYSDRIFNGQLKQITLSAPSIDLATFTDQWTGQVFRPYLKRYTVTEVLYRQIKAEGALNLLANDPFAVPIVIGGNVTNGYGIFTVMGVAVDTLQ